MDAAYHMRDGSAVIDPRLGRLPRFDERSRNYPLASILERRGIRTDDAAPIRSYTWRIRDWLNQRDEGACVLFCYGHVAAARPREQRGLTFEQLINKYHRAQARDPWEATQPGGEGGTSMLAGVQVMVEDRHFTAYDWVFGQDDGLRIALATLAYYRPLAMGTWWKTTMFDTDERGFLDISGTNAGGHAWCSHKLIARDARNLPAHRIGDIDLDNTLVGNRNSWGRSWGGGYIESKDIMVDPGDFMLTLRQWNSLRLDQGECLAPRERGGYFGG